MAWWSRWAGSNLPRRKIKRIRLAETNRAARWHAIAGNRSKLSILLFLLYSSGLSRRRGGPLLCLFGWNIKDARKLAEFVLILNGLYGDCIRGVYAPASLKQEQIGRQHTVRGQYPGRLRSGLIEAKVISVAAGLITTRYPGRLRSGLIEAE